MTKDLFRDLGYTSAEASEPRTVARLSEAIRSALDGLGVELTYTETDAAAWAALGALPYEYRMGEPGKWVGQTTVAPSSAAELLSQGADIVRRKVGPWEAVTLENAPEEDR